ncbi:MAG: hypothetical protein U0228_21910 [Myxococcaceae bacterium]
MSRRTSFTHALWLSTCALIISGCTCVDLTNVKRFGCADDGTCADSGTTTGGGAGGGTAGGGSAQGGGAQGGGAQGGGGGVPTCGPDNCAGCCDGTTCVTSTTATQCGAAGAACQACPSNQACVGGACEGCLQTCASGCCSGSTCQPPSATSCGVAGSVCQSCGLTGDACTGGQCSCGGGAACALGQRCVNGRCACDATSCAEGCCTPTGVCLRPNQQNGSQCGVGGLACQGCDVPPDATCNTSTERKAYRAPGSCIAGFCQYAEVRLDCAFGCDGGLCDNDLCQGCLVPPPAVCVGNLRRSFQSPGACGQNGCTYTQTDTTCVFGCQGGVCNPDPCNGVFCDQPPAPRCNGNVRFSYSAPGSCALGSCTYSESQTTCQFGCNQSTGQCNGDPCASVTCTSPPLSTCNGNVRHVFVSPGACAAGSCTYSAQDINCASGCNAGQCMGDPCQGVMCNAPPAPICLNGSTRRVYGSTGTCNQGACDYTPTDQTCPYGCANGACTADPCSGVSCSTPPGTTCQGNLLRTWSSSGTCSGGICSYTPTDTTCSTPPAATCANATTLRTFAATGSCNNGSCTYAPTDVTCATGCSNGACNADPCAGVTCTNAPVATCLNGTTRRQFGNPGTCSGGMCTYPTQDMVCNSPPAASCVNASTARTWSAAGTCASGSCSYMSTDTNCPSGCSNGACLGDPCSGVTCTTPPAATCANGTTRRTFAATGTCSGGSCSYAPNDTACNTPPAAACISASTLRTYSSAGTCASGTCSYAPSDMSCAFGCANARCNPDPCAGVTCGTAPSPDCANSNTRRTYTAPGTCMSGTCTYPSSQMVCNAAPAPTCNGANTVRTFSSNGTCNSGSCSYPPIDTPCNSPPAAQCVSGSSRVYASQGTCVDGAGTCNYTYTDTACQFGCSGGLCAGDPCAGVSCNSPPPSSCDDAFTLRIYSSSGTCSGGNCSYGSSTSSCPNGCANGACLPCNSATCPLGCCNSSGNCLDNDTYCRGTNGATCRTTGCSGGRICDVGVCVCPLRAPDPDSYWSEDPLICSML